MKPGIPGFTVCNHSSKVLSLLKKHAKETDVGKLLLNFFDFKIYMSLKFFVLL